MLGVGIVGVLANSLKDDYSRARIVAVLNPWSDPTGSGYQLIQGFYAFGSGGLFGVGIGMSKQKYSYLPMAYNDFIFAVVGEELGLVGTLGLLAAFGVLAWAGFRIARYAPDMCGRLIAAGCTSLIIIQLLVNVCGVLGLIPLSGKPVPFVSYGGSTDHELRHARGHDRLGVQALDAARDRPRPQPPVLAVCGWRRWDTGRRARSRPGHLACGQSHAALLAAAWRAWGLRLWPAHGRRRRAGTPAATAAGRLKRPEQQARQVQKADV